MNTDAPLPAIIVADDNPTDVFFLQRRLNSAGIRNPLVHVEDGMECIATLERVLLADPAEGPRPVLAFLDLKMPRMDGFEVLGWLRERGLSDQLTVVVLSTSDEPADIERSFRLGAHRFLVKYPRPEQLVEIMALAEQRMAARRHVGSTTSGWGG